METCVRNSLYDKALDVAKFACSLHRRHRLGRFGHAKSGTADGGRSVSGEERVRSGDSGSSGGDSEPSGADAIIFGIVCDVRTNLYAMRTQLLRELRSKLSLPACLRVVGHLRMLYHHLATLSKCGTRDSGGAAASSSDAASDTTAAVEVPVASEGQSLSDAVTARLQQEVLSCRTQWHRQEVAHLPSATAYNYVRQT